MLEQVQGDPFACQQHICETAGARDYFSDVNFFAISSKCFKLLMRIERNKNFFGGLEASDDHLLARNEASFRASVAHQHALSRDVAAPEILAQKKSNARIERAFVKPVHDSAS